MNLCATLYSWDSEAEPVVDKTEMGSTDVTFNGSHADDYMASKPKF